MLGPDNDAVGEKQNRESLRPEIMKADVSLYAVFYLVAALCGCTL